MNRGQFKYIKFILVVILFLINIAFGEFDAEELIIKYCRDNGHDFYSGQAELISRTSFTKITKDQIKIPSKNPNLNKEEISKKNEKYFKYLENTYSLNFSGSKPELQFTATKVYYDGDNKRKDFAIIDESQFNAIESGKMSLDSAPFERYYDDGSRMVSILDQGPGAYSPTALITNDSMGMPKIQSFGRISATPKQSEDMIKMLLSERYTIAKMETNEGVQVIAEGKGGFLTRLELVFDPDNEYTIKRITTYGDGHIFEERLFEGYFRTESNDLIPRKVISRQYAPIVVEGVNLTPEGDYKPFLTYEKVTKVINADFNIDIPSDIFEVKFALGVTVFDTTVNPPIQYVAHQSLMDRGRGDYFGTSALEDGLSSADESAVGKTEDRKMKFDNVQTTTSKNHFDNTNIAEQSDVAPKRREDSLSLKLTLIFIIALAFLGIVVVKKSSLKLFSR